MLTILKAGIYTTIQDEGRFNGAHVGIPISGPMDKISADIVNLLLENDTNDAVLECTYVGPTIQFHAPTLISIGGASANVLLNDMALDKQIIQIKKNDILSIGKITSGCRAYMGIKGGIQNQTIYGSRSTCHTAGISGPLRKGDQLPFEPVIDLSILNITMNRQLGNTRLTATAGPEYSLLSEAAKKALFDCQFTVLPSSNRMAYQVEHNLELAHEHSMLSSGTLPGTIQWLPSGELVILMRDCQTTGGYPRIMQLTEQSISDLSQLSPRSQFSIQLLD